MKFYGRAIEVANQLLEAFRDGRIPEALATIYLNRGNGERPMDNWSILNQVACIIAGCSDARGFEQWRQVERCVKKGEKARAAILIPLVAQPKEADEEGEENGRVYGFKGIPVFDVSQTDGEPLDLEHPHQAFIDSLPLIEVAHNWNLQVDTYTGTASKPNGYYRRGGGGIAMGVENENTWLHELAHAADDRLGHLKERGQHWRSETVAQLGACVLAKMIGREDIADEGKTYTYIRSYAEQAGKSVEAACCEVILRTAEAIELILQCYEAVVPVSVTAETVKIEVI